MKSTRKTQLAWVSELCESYGRDENCNGYELAAANIRACRDSRMSDIDAAEYMLRGLGLPGFPFADYAQEKQLREWGYNPTPRMVANFWTVSAGLLVEVLRAHGCRLS